MEGLGCWERRREFAAGFGDFGVGHFDEQAPVYAVIEGFNLAFIEPLAEGFVVGEGDRGLF
jgi:hypothetical protein